MFGLRAHELPHSRRPRHPHLGLSLPPCCIFNVSKFRLMKTRCRRMEMLIILKRGAKREGVITRVEVKINRDMWLRSCHVQG